MANLIFDKAQIEAAIDKIVDRTMRMDMTWDWPCGVAYYGICEAYEVTKNERYLQLVKDRVDEYIELGLPSWTVNPCSMGRTVVTVAVSGTIVSSPAQPLKSSLSQVSESCQNARLPSGCSSGSVKRCPQ